VSEFLISESPPGFDLEYDFVDSGTIRGTTSKYPLQQPANPIVPKAGDVDLEVSFTNPHAPLREVSLEERQLASDDPIYDYTEIPDVDFECRRQVPAAALGAEIHNRPCGRGKNQICFE
jgi:hypothetical protein